MIQSISEIYKKSFTGLNTSVWILSVVTLINRAGTMVIPFLAIYLTEHLNYSYVQVGLIISSFGLGSILGTALGGFLTDHLGYYKVMGWSLILSSFTFWNLLFVEGLYQWVFGVFLVSLVADNFRPASMASIGFYEPEKNRTRAMALIRLAINLGISIGPALGGFIAIQYGYKWLFILDGITCLCAGLFLFVFLPKPDIKKQIQEENKTLNFNKMSTNIVKSPYSNPFFLVYIFLLFLIGFIFLQFFGSLILYFKEVLLINEFGIGMLLTLNGILIVIIEMPLIYFQEHKGHKLNKIAIGALLIGLAFFVLLIGKTYLIAIICVLFLTIGEIYNFPFSSSYALSFAQPINRGAYMGLYGMSFGAAHVLSHSIGLYIIQHYGYNTLWAILGCIGIFAAWGFYYLKIYNNKPSTSIA